MTFGTPNIKNRVLSNVLNVLNFCNMLQYRLKYETVRTTIAKYILLFYSRFLSPHHRYLSLHLLISVFSIRLPQHANHQRPPLDAVDHLSSLFCFGFIFFFPFFFFLFTFFGYGLMGGFEWPISQIPNL